MKPFFIVHLLDIVVLLRDRDDFGLAKGEIGTVVEVYGDGEAYEVEFTSDHGQTYALVTLRADEVLGLHIRGRSFAFRTVPLDTAPTEEEAIAAHAPAGASVRPLG